MARQGINTGTAPNDGTGDTLFIAGDKTNDNFIELYNLLGNGSALAPGVVTSITAGSNISLSGSSGQVQVTGIAATNNVVTNTLTVAGVSSVTNQVKILSDDGTPGRIDYYCESGNAHYTRVQAPPHAQYSGNNTVVLPVEKISTTSPGSYMSSSATTNPVLTFGDTSSMNGGTIINDYADPAPWPFRIRDLWIANNGNISASDCVGVSTFRDRNIASWSEYSDVDVYITMDGSGVTAVKGSPTVERKSITFS